MRFTVGVGWGAEAGPPVTAVRNCCWFGPWRAGAGRGRSGSGLGQGGSRSPALPARRPRNGARQSHAADFAAFPLTGATTHPGAPHPQPAYLPHLKAGRPSPRHSRYPSPSCVLGSDNSFQLGSFPSLPFREPPSSSGSELPHNEGSFTTSAEFSRGTGPRGTYVHASARCRPLTSTPSSQPHSTAVLEDRTPTPPSPLPLTVPFA